MSRIIALVVSASSVVAGEARPLCRVTPFRTGVCHLGADHVLGEGHRSDERIPFAIYAFLVEGPSGQKALVDLGPMSLDYLNRMFRRYSFFRDLGPDVAGNARYPDDIVQPEGNIFVQLKRRRVDPEDIGHIIFTHLHADHHGMHDATDGGAAEYFTNAILHVSLTGWQNNLRKRVDGRWNSYVDHAFSDFLVRRERDGKVRFEDNRQIFPGLRTLYLGGHCVCSQAVVVDTPEGTAIIASDEVYLYRLLKENILPAIRTSEKRYRAAIKRLVTLAQQEKGVIIPLHDPRVWKAYETSGGAWISALRATSERAVRGYRELQS